MIQKYILIIFTVITIILLILNHTSYSEFELIEAQTEIHTDTSGEILETGSTTGENIEFSMAELHRRLIQPMDREEWIEKIWSKNKNLESHENLEKITILCEYQIFRNFKILHCSRRLSPCRW